MLPIAQEYFKNNPEAKSCHVVLSQVFVNAKDAFSYKKAMNARAVTSYMRPESVRPAPIPGERTGRNRKSKN